MHNIMEEKREEGTYRLSLLLFSDAFLLKSIEVGFFFSKSIDFPFFSFFFSLSNVLLVLFSLFFQSAWRRSRFWDF